MKKYCLRLLAAALACLMLLTGCGEGSEKKTDKEKKREKTVSVDCLISMEQDYGDGAVVLKVSYKDDGILLSPPELVDAYMELYTPQGLEIYSLYYNEEGTQRYRMDYTYDENGRKTESLQTNLIENRIANRGTYTYDDKGNLLRISDFTEGGYLINYAEFGYDDRGYPASYDYVDHEGTNLWHYDYTCDDSGRIVTGTVRYILQDDQLTQLGYYTCSYDDAGRLVSQIWKTTKNSYFVFQDYYYTYDEAGRLIGARTVDDDGEVDSNVVYTYDDQGRLLSIVDDVEGSSLSFNYGTMELSAKLAEDAKTWSTQGLIQVMAPMPEYER